MTVTKILYSTKATATGGRDGRAKTHDGALDLSLVTPRELGGAGGDGVNPEQLFAAGYAACFLSALKNVARAKDVAIPDSAEITATVGIGPRADVGFGLDVQLEATLPGIADEVADALIAAAHQVCPYSHATRGSLDITPKRAA